MLGLGFAQPGPSIWSGSRWRTSQLYDGAKGIWPDGFNPYAGRVAQDVAGNLPAMLPGDPVGLIRRAAGSVNGRQTIASSRPLLARSSRGIWHLQGGSMSVVIPSGSYGLAWVDTEGVVTFTTGTSDGSTPISILRDPQLADVILRQGAFSPAESARITDHWRRYLPRPDLPTPVPQMAAVRAPSGFALVSPGGSIFVRRLPA